MSPSPSPKMHWFRLLLNKRLTLSLFVILPVVFGLMAFASGFIALILVEHFLISTNGSISVSTVQETMRYIRLEVLGFTLLGVMAGFGVAFAIVRPLKQLAQETGRMVSGESGETPPFETLAELGPVGQDFHRVVSTLKQDLIDSMAWGWIMLAPSGRIAAMNAGAEQILGIPSASLVNQPFQKLADTIQMEDDLMDTIGRSLNGTSQASGKVMQIQSAEGRTVRLSFTTTVLTGSDNQTLGIALTFKDLTRSKEISEQMQRTDKLAAMGTLAACVAHEVRNPLGAIKGLAQLLDEAFEEGDTHRTYTRTMIKEIDRLNEVVTNLVDFSQPSSAGRTWCNPNDLLEQALFLGRVDSGQKEVILERNLHPNLPEVWVDSHKIIQAVLNLLLNAVEAIESGGTVRVASGLTPELDGEPQHIRISVTNAGKPLEPEVQVHMFDPFYTTKKNGTGLGLAITSQIVSSHGGRLSVDCDSGWTSFTLELPVVNREAAQESLGLKS